MVSQISVINRGGGYDEVLVEKRHFVRREIKKSQLAKESDVGIYESRQQGPLSAFFQSLVVLLGVSFDTVSLITYAILAALIECCTLAVLSIKKVSQGTHQLLNQTPLDGYKKKATRHYHAQQSRLLKWHVLNGDSEPKIGALVKTYHLQYAEVKYLLDGLVDEGALEKQGNRYRMVVH